MPYSSIVSSAQLTDDSIVINSGMAKTVSEYSKDGVLLSQFTYEANKLAYRVSKQTFDGYWFD